MSIFSKAWKSIRKAAKAVVRSPVVKFAAVGLTIVAPPAGAGAMAGLAVADKVIKATESKDPKRRAEAKKVIANTVKVAKAGNVHARHGSALLALAKRRDRVRTALMRDVQRRRKA